MSITPYSLRRKFFLAIACACAAVLGASAYGVISLADIHADLLDRLASSGALPAQFLETLREQILTHEKRITAQAILAGTVAVTFGATLVYALVANLVAFLRRLKHAMRAVAQGDLSQRMRADADDETRLLAMGFNNMVAALEDSRQSLLQAERYSHAILDNVAEAIFTTDQRGYLRSWNHSAEQLFGFTEREALGMNLTDLLTYPDPSLDGDTLCERMLGSGSRGAERFELTAHTKNAGDKQVEAGFSRLRVGDDTHCIGVVRDLTELKEQQRQLNYLARFDALTGLPNRLHTREQLESAMARSQRNERLVAVLCLDLDRFLAINESLGHAVGDRLLIECGERLRRCIRQEDTLGRLGGDEFCVVLEGINNVVDATVVAQKILDELEHAFHIADQNVYTSASIGITVYPFDDDDAETLLKDAESAMARVKRNGGNQYAFFADDMNSQSLARMKLTGELREALDKEQFELFYQPQIDLQSGEIIGSEALLRWHHPEFGLVSPASFIPILEETGLIVAVGEWTIRNACQQSLIWQESGLPALRIAVNLSARQFREKDFVERVQAILAQTKVSADRLQAQVKNSTAIRPDCLELELTEGMLMENTDSSCNMLASLKDMGIKISVDDFGTGYSSLSYLKRFPLDTLKIDQSFVREIGADEEDQSIVMAIIDLAHNLGMAVIAEGVETMDQLAFLREKGCNEVQGYLFNKPVAADEFAQWCRDWQAGRHPASHAI